LTDFFAIAPDPVPPISQANPPQPTFSPISPRFGGKFTSGPGTGYESSFGSVSGFVPITQTAGKNLLFTEGKLNISTENGNLGGNLRLGYRTVLPESNLVLGGYLGYDIRDTGNTTFHQLGAGLEALANGWEARLNGYLPVGDRRNLVHEQTFGFSNLRFTSNFLVGTRLVTRSFEASMAGFDLEGGVKLLSWNSGNLKAFAGMYLYSAPEMGSFAGFRTRLQADINENLATGLALETDGKYGTRLIASVGVSFGDAPVQRQLETPEESITARLGSPFNRQENISVDQQRELQPTSDVALTNPATGQPWRFVHVTPGVTGGTGTAESPLGEIAGNAVNNAFTDGNNIIYVQGAGTVAGNFTIPDNVQLLSAAVPQLINTVQINTVQLPGSGTGVYPGINNTVRMGNNTVISGFAITPPSGSSAIAANGVQNVTIRDNRVQVSGDDTSGIHLQNVTGIATVTSNTVTTTGNSTGDPPLGAHAIFVEADGTTLDSLLLNNNQVSTSGNRAIGIAVVPWNSGIITSVTASGNTVTTSGEEGYGIVVFADRNGRVANATLSGNTITTTGTFSAGLFVPLDNGVINTLTIADNTATSTIGNNTNGIRIIPENNSRIDTMTLSGNTLTIRDADIGAGIEVRPDQSTIATAIVSGNTITTAGSSEGIFFSLRNNSKMESWTVSGNTISTTGYGATGIHLTSDNSEIGTTTISGNTINTAGVEASGILVAPQTGSQMANVTVSSNSITTAGDTAHVIEVGTLNDSVITNATVTGNIVTANGSNSIGILVIPYDINPPRNAPINVITLSNNQVLRSGSENVMIWNVGGQPICAVITGNLTQNPGAGYVNFGLRTTGDPFRVVDLRNLSANNNGATFSFDMATPPPPFPDTIGNFTTVTTCPYVPMK